MTPCGCGPEVPEGSLLGDLGSFVIDMCRIIREDLAWAWKIASDPKRRRADKILSLIVDEVEEDRRDEDYLFSCSMVELWQKRASEKLRLFSEISAMNEGNKDAAVDKIRLTMREKMAHFGITDEAVNLLMVIINAELKKLADDTVHKI